MSSLHRSTLALGLLGAVAATGAPPAKKTGSPKSIDVGTEAKRICHMRNKGAVVNTSPKSVGRAARRRGEISARQQQQAAKLLCAVRRGAPTFAGREIRICLEGDIVANTRFAVYLVGDHYEVHYEDAPA